MATMQIKVTKAKANIAVDFEKLPQEVYEALLAAGAEVYLGKKMTKITAKDISDETARKAEAMRIAQDNLEQLYAGNLAHFGRAKKAAKVSGKVNTEAMRIARQMVKDAMKEEGIKVSHVDAKEITALAKEVIASEAGAGIIAQAEANLAAAEEKKAGIGLGDLVKSIKINPKKKAAAEEKMAKDKAAKAAQLSAKQAGMVQVRGKVGVKPVHA